MNLVNRLKIRYNERILLILLALQFFSSAKAQITLNPDSLKLLLSAATDTTRVLLLAQLGESYAFVQIDTALLSEAEVQ
jgi:hypothetical protein